MKRIGAIAAIYVVLVFAVTACGPGSEQLAAWQDASTQLGQEIQQVQVELATVEDPVQRASLEAKLQILMDMHTRLDAAIQDAETSKDAGWALLETAVGVAGGFFPPALLALPFIRTARKSLPNIMAAVEAGGGVVNPQAAKAALKADPKAYATLQAWKAKNGHKATT